MRDIPTRKFCRDTDACTEGKEYASQFSTMSECIDALLEGKNGMRDVEWLWWTLIAASRFSEHLTTKLWTLKPWFGRLCLPRVDKEIGEKIMAGFHGEYSEKRAADEAITKAFVFRRVYLSDEVRRAALHSCSYGMGTNLFRQGIQCMLACMLAETAKSLGNADTTWYNCGIMDVSRALPDEVALTFPGESEYRYVPLECATVVPVFLTKFRELGNPYKEE